MREARSLVCESIRSQLSLRLDGELSEFEHALVDAHLDDCSACRSFDYETRATTDLLRAARLEQSERPVSLPRGRRISLRALQVGAAAATLTAAIGLAGLPAMLGSERAPARPQPLISPLSYLENGPVPRPARKYPKIRSGPRVPL